MSEWKEQMHSSLAPSIERIEEREKVPQIDTDLTIDVRAAGGTVEAAEEREEVG